MTSSPALIEPQAIDTPVNVAARHGAVAVVFDHVWLAFDDHIVSIRLSALPRARGPSCLAQVGGQVIVIESVVFHGVSGSSRAVSHSSLAGAVGLVASYGHRWAHELVT